MWNVAAIAPEVRAIETLWRRKGRPLFLDYEIGSSRMETL
jgi:hypothetical protein